MRHQSEWQFKPPVWAWVLTLVGLLLFSSLSWWQIGRAEEKRELLSLFEEEAERRDVAALSDLRDLPRFAPLRLRGEFLGERGFLLESMLREGQPGFHVWTPMRLAEDGALIIVDQGWIPEQEAPPALPPEGELEVEGRLDELPRPGFRLGAPEPEGDWPRRIYFPDADALERQLDEAVHDGRLLMSADEDFGYRRDWNPVNMPPERHLGYAFQWGALAVAALVLFVVVNLRRVRNHDRR